MTAAVIDAYSRKIVGWAMGQQHDTELVKRALQMALIQQQPTASLVHHSDRESEYASKSYQKMLQDHGIRFSMSKKSDCYDNAPIESFWETLKEKCLGKNTYHTRKEAKTAVFDYIETFYNRKRKHSSLTYLSPEVYKKRRKDQGFLKVESSEVKVTRCSYKINLVLSTFKKPCKKMENS